MFSCEFGKIFKSTFFTEYIPVAVSETLSSEFSRGYYRCMKLSILANPANTPRVFYVETTWNCSFPRRFNVEYTWSVCGEGDPCFIQDKYLKILLLKSNFNVQVDKYSKFEDSENVLNGLILKIICSEKQSKRIL